MARFNKTDVVIETGQQLMKVCMDQYLPWDALSVWVELDDDGRQAIAYRYHNGEAHDWDPGGGAFLDQADAMRVATFAADGRRWNRALIQISRPGPKLIVTYDHEDPQRLALDRDDIGRDAHAEAMHPDNLWAAPS